MQYAIGTHVVHPAHGAGTIIDIREHEMNDGLRNYYVIQFSDQNLTVSVPVRRTEEIGIRDVMTEGKFEQVMKTLSLRPKQLPQDYKERRHALSVLVHSGRPVDVAEAVRDLIWRREEKHLTLADSRFLDQARTMLIEEMVLATGQSHQEIDTAIEAALLEAMAKQMASPDEKVH
ncbi:MAG: hypothetical protein KDD78_16375 [Caldilineaceae bacterium]|nr:hypothetical protein [Caldilineaceae bacterium]